MLSLDFFFLPPMMPDPSGHSNFDDGAFNARLGPTVSICQLAADPNANPMTDCALEGGAPDNVTCVVFRVTM